VTRAVEKVVNLENDVSTNI